MNISTEHKRLFGLHRAVKFHYVMTLLFFLDLILIFILTKTDIELPSSIEMSLFLFALIWIFVSLFYNLLFFRCPRCGRYSGIRSLPFTWDFREKRWQETTCQRCCYSPSINDKIWIFESPSKRIKRRKVYDADNGCLDSQLSYEDRKAQVEELSMPLYSFVARQKFEAAKRSFGYDKAEVDEFMKKLQYDVGFSHEFTVDDINSVTFKKAKRSVPSYSVLEVDGFLDKVVAYMESGKE